MPHFNSSGEETYLCQKCGREFSASQRKPISRHDITGSKSAGTCCEPCVKAFDAVHPKDQAAELRKLTEQANAIPVKILKGPGSKDTILPEALRVHFLAPLFNK